MERLTRLRDLLAEAVTVIGEVAASGGLLEQLRAEDDRLALLDQRGWGYVCDSLSVALEAGEMGSVRQSLDALASVLEV